MKDWSNKLRLPQCLFYECIDFKEGSIKAREGEHREGMAVAPV